MTARKDLASFDWYDWRHAIIVPQGHALCTGKPPSLGELAEQPLITYHEGFTGRARIYRAFHEAGLAPDIEKSALDADVIKTYVELGLGVGIVASMAFQPRKDEGLVMIEAPDVFPVNTAHVAVRRGHYLRGFAYRFIALCSERLDEATVRAAVAAQRDGIGID